MVPSGKYHLLDDIRPGFISPATRWGILLQITQWEHPMNEDKPGKTTALALLGLGLALIAVSGHYFFRDVSNQNDPSTIPAQISYSAPQLMLIDLDGSTRSLTDYHGQVTLVNLWATWCPPCKEEMPTLQAYYNKHRDEGFVVIAVNDGDPISDVLQFVKDYKLTFPVWLDPTYIATEQAFKTLNLPSSFVIDRSGIVRLQWVGEINRKMLEQYVTPLIKEN
jgi:thiol-disulfide isomerase/thioredoxin